jgi:hypothetical protein
MENRDKSCYPFVWFGQGGWWFKVFDECFGPYEHAADAQKNLLIIRNLSRQLSNELKSRQASF